MAGCGEGRYWNVNNVNKWNLKGGGQSIGGQDNLQLLIILPYIISIYNVQIHCEHFRGLQALSQCFLIMVNSPMEEFLTIFSRSHAKIH